MTKKSKRIIGRMSRRKKPPEILKYGGQVASRLKQLRDAKGYSIEELQAELKKHGFSISTASLYAYEVGKDAGGVDLPIRLIPAFAAVYGITPNGFWLP